MTEMTCRIVDQRSGEVVARCEDPTVAKHLIATYYAAEDPEGVREGHYVVIGMSVADLLTIKARQSH